MLGTFLALAVLLLGGGGIAAAVLARRPRIPLIEFFCLSWLFGVGFVSLTLWIASGFLSGLGLQVSTAAIAICLALGGWRAMRKAGSRFVWPRLGSKVEYLLIALLVIEFAAVAIGSARQTLGWDGLFVWEIKARIAFLSGGHLPAPYFSDGGWTFSHPEYPLAIPFTQLWIYLCRGEANQFWAKTIFPIFYAVGATLLAILAARLTGRRTFGYLLALLLFFVPQATILSGGALTGYADFPLAIFYLAAIAYLLCAISDKTPTSFLTYAICLALLPWIKKEGAILWAIGALAGVVVIIHQRRSWTWWLALLPGLVVIATWKAFLVFSHSVAPADFGAVSLAELNVHADRLVPILRNVFAELASIRHWGIFWLLVAVALVSAGAAWRRLPFILLAATIVLPILIYSSLYVFSAWPVYLNHLHSSLARLLLQVTPLAFLLIGLAMSKWHRRTADRIG